MTDQTQAPGPAAWAELAAGPATPASFTALTDADPAALSGAQLADAIVCSEKVASLALGLQPG